MKKIGLSLFALIFLFGSVSPVLAEVVSKEDVIKNAPSNSATDLERVGELEGENSEDIEALETLFADDTLLQRTIETAESQGWEYKPYQTQVGGTAAVKAGVKSLIRNKSKVIGLVKTVGGKRAARSLEIRWDKYIDPTLKKLLKYEDLAWGTVEGHLASALHGTNIKSSTARSIAYWVVYVAKWLL